MSYRCRYDTFETYKFNVSVVFRNVILQWRRMLNVLLLNVTSVCCFAAGSRRVTHCKGRIHPERHRRKHTLTPSLSLKQSLASCLSCSFFLPTLHFVTSHHDLCVSPHPVHPYLFFFCLFFFPSPPPHTHTSPSSPHFTTSLSDYADLSEPPRKKDWVF